MQLKTYVLTLLILALPIISQAGVTGTTGAVTPVSAPSDVSNGVRESDTQIIAFNEQQNILLSAGITVDISVPGSTPASPTNDNFSTATLAAGLAINSYFLHFDAVGSPSPALELTGSITFDHDILGLVILSSSLNATATMPGLPGTTYSINGGLEINNTAAFDSITLSADRRTVTVDLRDAGAPDDVRIITAVPEPGTLSLLAFAAAGLTLRRRR